jgi:polysaccharide pyruvyl transferase WcaK-like protein
VNFHLFPVGLRPFARKADRYQWPYAFSRSRERSRAAAALASAYAELADWIVDEHGRSVALLCMEELDGPFAAAVQGKMRHGDRTRIFSSRDYNASQMAGLLRSLDLLVTARYHAAVLSLAAAVPQVAVGHDLRLRSLYDELGLSDLFVDARSPDLVEILKGPIRRLLAEPASMRVTLQQKHEELLARAKRNRKHLGAFFSRRGWGP